MESCHPAAGAALYRALSTPRGHDPDAAARAPLPLFALLGFWLALLLALYTLRVAQSVWGPLAEWSALHAAKVALARAPLGHAALALLGLAAGPLAALATLVLVLGPLAGNPWCLLELLAAMLAVLALGAAAHALRRPARDRAATPGAPRLLDRVLPLYMAGGRHPLGA